MGIDPDHLRQYVIKPALTMLNMHSLAAECLVFGTAVQESKCGRYLRQLGNGPARGIFQMEPETYNDIWENYLRYRPAIIKQIAGGNIETHASADKMETDLIFAAMMCRIHYRRVPAPLPEVSFFGDNIQGLAVYWKKNYNTYKGKGTVDEFVKNWFQFAGGR